MEPYDLLAHSRAALQPLQDLYHSLHSAMSGNVGSTGSGSARPSGSGSSGQQLEVEQAEAKLVLSRDKAPWVDYTVKPKASKVPNVEALQMVGFANPFNASTVLVTQVSATAGPHSTRHNTIQQAYFCVPTTDDRPYLLAMNPQSNLLPLLPPHCRASSERPTRRAPSSATSLCTS
jgi:hypothetical protein